MVQKIEISYKTIIFAIASLLFLWFLYTIRSIVVLVFVALLFATTINPLVNRIQRFKIPRVGAILIIYGLFLTVVSVVISLIVPSLIEQTAVLSESLAAPIKELPFLQVNWDNLSGQLELVSKNLVGLIRILISAASNILTLFALLVLTFYFTYEKQNMNKYLDTLFGVSDTRKAKVSHILHRLDVVLGGWLRAQILLVMIIATASYVGLLALGIHYALPLALLAGLLELVPNLGPTLAAVPAVLTGWSISTMTGIGALILYFVIQQVENYVIVPQVMKKETGLNPLVSLLCLLIGGKVYGVVGVLLSIPVFLTIKTVVQELYFSE